MKLELLLWTYRCSLLPIPIDVKEIRVFETRVKKHNNLDYYAPVHPSLKYSYIIIRMTLIDELNAIQR